MFLASLQRRLPSFLSMAQASYSAQAVAVGEEIQLAVPWGNVAGLAYGPSDGDPVLGLHGWLDNANTFIEVAKYLTPGIRFVAIDLPGHGFSSHKPPGSSYTMFNYVRLLLPRSLLTSVGPGYRVC